MHLFSNADLLIITLLEAPELTEKMPNYLLIDRERIPFPRILELCEKQTDLFSI